LKILETGKKQEIRALFAFDNSDTADEVLLKFNLWSRYFFSKFFKFPDAAFHNEIDTRNLAVYRGTATVFIDIAFRGAAKTTRTKLLIAYCIANDSDHLRRYIKVLAADGGNAKQIVTDVYNMLINKAVIYYYPEIFEKTEEKREERMSVFTTATGVKMQADTVGTDQRGDIQDDARPDFIWFDDFETRKTLRSAIVSNAINDNMEEARNGLSKTGASLYNCNYLSERGNVHRLVTKHKECVLITPIKGKVVGGLFIDGLPTWNAYTAEEVELKLKSADDPAGEYLCVPSAGLDIFFDRTCLDKQERKVPIREVAGFKIFHAYDASHRYGSGHDVSGGVGLDSSTSAFIDFSTFPSKVVATYQNNLIKPDTFGHEIAHQSDRFGRPVVAVENNMFDMCIGVLKLKDVNLFFTDIEETRAGLPPRTKYYGWNTNSDTKSKMMFTLKKAVEDGHLELSDEAIILELASYTRDDLMDRADDVRLTTRHFDLLMAVAIAYQMKNHAEVKRVSIDLPIQEQPYEYPGF